MNFGQARVRLVEAGAVIAACAFVAGCGNSYRPVVTPINPTGPAAQPSAYAVVISAPSPTTAGIATVIDYSGDTVLAQAPIGLGPKAFVLDELGADGYTINSDGTLTNFPVSSDLQAKQVLYTTLPATAQPVNMYAPSSGLWAADETGNIVDYFNSSPETFVLAIPVAQTPVLVVGTGSTQGQRNYVVSDNFVDPTISKGVNGVTCNIAPRSAPTGLITPIETSSNSPDTAIPVGKCPVYAIESSDTRRIFVLNRGDDTVTVVNGQNNSLDSCTGLVNQNGQPITCHPTLPLSLSAVTATGITPPNGTAGMTNTAGPVYAEYSSITNQLVVANYDAGTVSIIDVSLDEYGNDSSTFGTTYTVPVGTNPASVTVLADGSRAYVANQSDGTVSIVNMSSHTLEKVLPVTGHPRTVVSTQNSLYGKVYVASPDSSDVTIIRTDQDIISTSILVQGNAIDVRTTSPDASSSNVNTVSRLPGAGQPCFLAPSTFTPASVSDCQLQQVP